MSGKGSRRRPTLIPAKDFGENWAKIFEKQKQEKKADERKDNSVSDGSKRGDGKPDRSN